MTPQGVQFFIVATPQTPGVWKDSFVHLPAKNPYANRQYKTHGGTALVEKLYLDGLISKETRDRKLKMLRFKRKLRRKGNS